MKYLKAHMLWGAIRSSASAHRWRVVFVLVAGFTMVLAAYVLMYRMKPLSAVEQCKDATYKNTCYNDVINKTFKERGLAAAFDTLSAVYDADPSYLVTCHAEVHELGKAAYLEFHTSGNVELSSKTTYCGYGFYHGFMEELIYQTGDFGEAQDFCAYAGAQVPNPPGYAQGACYHGIGHGVTDGTDPRLWGSAINMVTPGLALCEKVAENTPDWQYRCDSGVFNSIALLYPDEKYRLNAHGDPFSLCKTSSFSVIEKRACYDQMNTLAMRMAGFDFGTAIRSVESITNREYRLIAIHGLSGMYFSNARNRRFNFSPKEVSDVCASLGADAEACITGVIGGIQEFGTPGAEYKDMFPLCDSPELNKKFAPACYAGIIDSTKSFRGLDEAKRVCALVPAPYRTAACSQ